MGSGACRKAGSPASAEPVSASEAVSAAVFGAQPARALAPTTPAAASPVNLNKSRRVTSMMTLLNDGRLLRTALPSRSAGGTVLFGSVRLPGAADGLHHGPVRKTAHRADRRNWVKCVTQRHNPERDLGRWVILNGDIANQITRKILEIVGSFEQSDVARSEVAWEFRVCFEANCLQWVDLLLEIPDYFSRDVRNP